jgi:hypothetical protein
MTVFSFVDCTLTNNIIAPAMEATTTAMPMARRITTLEVASLLTLLRLASRIRAVRAARSEATRPNMLFPLNKRGCLCRTCSHVMFLVDAQELYRQLL